jgi:hypothetical protein
MGLHHMADGEGTAQVEQPVVLVGCVDEDGVAGRSAPHDVDVVVHGADHHTVDLHRGVLIVDDGVRHDRDLLGNDR